MSIKDTTADLKFTILGCGTSTGVPIPNCPCPVCRSRNPKNHRLRASAWIQKAGKSIIVDTGPDLRTQCLRAKVSRIDAVLYSHPHADHLHGIDELRTYNYYQKSAIPVYGNSWMISEIKSRFPYIFHVGPAEGGGRPAVETHEIDPSKASFQAAGLKIIPIPHAHGSQESLGYRIDDVAYIADCSYIPVKSLDRLKGLAVLVLDCVRLEPHNTHFHLDKSLEVISELKPRRAFLTHLGHDFDYAKWNGKLPKGVQLAYDGLTFSNRSIK